MNVIKQFNNTNSFEDYLSFSRCLLNRPQYAVQHIQFNAASINAIKKLIIHEVQYFNKYNEVGAVFTVFDHMIQTKSTHAVSTEEIAAVFFTLLDAVCKNHIKQTGKWNFLSKIMMSIQTSCRKNEGLCSVLVEQVSEQLLMMATDNSFQYPQKVKILWCFNYCCFRCSRELRLQEFQKLNPYFTKLAHYIVECNDFYGQLTILKTLIKWLVHREDPIKKAEIAKDWFPSHIFSERAIKFFITSNFRNFLVDTRQFLNIQNETTKLIVSVKCRKLRVGNKLLISGEENFSMWFDVNVMVKELTVLIDINRINASKEIDQRLDLLILHQDNIGAAKLDKGSDYILSICLLKPPTFLYTATDDVLKGDSTNVSVVLERDGDMSRFENTLRDVLCDKLILQNGLDQQVPPCSRTKLKNYGVMREHKSFATPSSVSTSSLRQLCCKIKATPNKFCTGKFEGVASASMLSVVKEMTEPSISVNSFDTKFSDQVHFETKAIVHSPRQPRANKRDADENERVLKVHELNDLDRIAGDDVETRCDNLDYGIVDQLLKEVFIDITDADRNATDRDATNEGKTGTVKDSQKLCDVDKANSKNEMNGFATVAESKSNSIISDTPMCFANTRRNRWHEMKENGRDWSADGVNVDAVEEFFSQHMIEREDGHVVVSPSVARRMNRSSSSSGVNEPVICIEELIEIADLVGDRAATALGDPTAPKFIDILTDEEVLQQDTSNEKAIDRVAEDHENEAPVSSSQKTITRNSKTDKSKYDTTLVFSLDDIDKSGPTQAEKKEVIVEAKKRRGRKTQIKPPSQRVKKTPVENKPTDTRKSQELEVKSISEIENQKNETTRPLRKRRTLFHPVLDQIEEQKQDDNDFKDVNRSSVLSKSPVRRRLSVYEKIEKEKPKRQTRNRPKRQRQIKRVTPDGSPRTKKMDDMFEMVKNSVDLNTVQINTAKLADSGANNILVYNFTSDSEENFKTNASVKSIPLKSNKGPAGKTNQRRSRRKLFTDETKKPQIGKSGSTKKGRPKKNVRTNKKPSKNNLTDERMRNAASNDALITNTSINITNDIDNEGAERVLPLEVTTLRIMELIPDGAEKSILNNKSDVRKTNIIDEAQNIAGESQKEEDDEKYHKKRAQEKADEREISPLPGLVIEAVPSHDNVKDSTISTNAFDKIKKFYQNANDMRENITGTTVNITDIEIMDHEIPPLQVSIDQGGEKKDYSERVLSATAEDVVVICSSNGDKSERTIDTLRTKSPIDGHGDSKESPPDPKLLSKSETPRDKNTENFSYEVKKYYSDFHSKLNALYESDSNGGSENSSRRPVPKSLDPKVVIEKMANYEKSINAGNAQRLRREETESTPIGENEMSEIEANEPGLPYWKKNKGGRAKEEPNLSSIRKTRSPGPGAASAVNRTLGSNKGKNFEQKVSTALKTSSPKKENRDLLFDIRRLEVKISPIRNIDWKRTSDSGSSSGHKMSLRRNLAKKGNVSYRERMIISRKHAASGGELLSENSCYSRSANKNSESSEAEVVKNLFGRFENDRTDTTSEGRRLTRLDKSDEATSPRTMFQRALNTFYENLEETNTTKSTLKTTLNPLRKLQITATSDVTPTKNSSNVPNKINETSTTEVTTKKNRQSYNVSQRELKNLKGEESKNTTQKENYNTTHSDKYYLRNADSKSYLSKTKDSQLRYPIRSQGSRKRVSMNRPDAVEIKKKRLDGEAPRTRSEVSSHSVAVGTCSSVINWLEDAVKSNVSDEENVIDYCYEVFLNVLERFEITCKENCIETSQSFLNACSEFINKVLQLKEEVTEKIIAIQEMYQREFASSLDDFKKLVADIMTREAKKKHLMMTVVREDLMALKRYLAAAKISKKRR